MKVIILDRDGVINEDSPEYIKSVAEWYPIAGSIEAIARLSKEGWRVFIATNQSAIGRGYMDINSLSEIHDRLRSLCMEIGGYIEGIEYAPEHPDHASERRKPNPGMLKDIAQRLKITLENVPFVGDSWTDILAARAAGAIPVLVKTGNGDRTAVSHSMDGVMVYSSLAEFASILLAKK